MKNQVLFSPKNDEKVFMNVVCCSRDWRLRVNADFFNNLRVLSYEGSKCYCCCPISHALSDFGNYPKYSNSCLSEHGKPMSDCFFGTD